MPSLEINTPLDLSEFMAGKQKEILAFAQKNTEETVKTEMALLDFELLLAVSSDKGEVKKVQYARKLREESWKEIEEKFEGNHDKMMNFLSEF